jgi:hypothetical protein
VEFGTEGVEVFLNLVLSAILSAATKDDINLVREGVTGVVLVEYRLVAILLESSHDSQYVSVISVNIHITCI